jgi:hypothetical protein
MTEVPFHAAAHVRAREHLITAESIALFDEILESSSGKKNELRRKLANYFEIPNEARQTRGRLKSSLHAVIVVARRILAFKERGLHEGAAVRFEDKIYLIEKVHEQCTLVLRKYYFVNPDEVTLYR